MNRPITILATAAMVLALTACSGKQNEAAAATGGEAPAASSKPNPWSSDAPAAEPAKAAAPAEKAGDAKPKPNPWAKDAPPEQPEAVAEKAAK